jgi:hypothetical protein
VPSEIDQIGKNASNSPRLAKPYVISLAQFATGYTRSWAPDSTNGKIRTKAEHERAQQEILSLREEIRIKGAHMGQNSPQHRVHDGADWIP